MAAEGEHEGFKVGRIIASLAYPPISAWEFRVLQNEKDVRDRIEDSTIYIIGQRPLLRFDAVTVGDSTISFQITDGISTPVLCVIDPWKIGIAKIGEPIDIQFSFHRDPLSTTQPLNDVAAIRIYDTKQNFKVWWSPQKFIYEVLVRGLPAKTSGKFDPYLDFEVHYIGKAFSQTVWDRLKPHVKYKDILTEEDIRGSGHSRPSLEVTLFMIEITGFDDQGYLYDPNHDDSSIKPILFQFSDDTTDPRSVAFAKSLSQPEDKEVTAELEAMLIHKFKPAYNEILYDNYPYIKGGLRDCGYTDTEFQLDGFPFRLLTKTGAAPLEDGELDPY